MQIDIQTSGFSLTETLKSYTTRRMRFACSRNDTHVMRARVLLADINGPRGGVDKRCQIELTLTGQQNIIIEDIQADLYVAIDRASERSMRTLARRVERSRQQGRDLQSSPEY